MNNNNQNIYIKSLSIHGYRGFADPQTINFAIPDGTRGSGLTIIVGPNNAGKSTIVESLKAISRPQNQTPSFTEGKRNKHAGDRVTIEVENSQGQKKKLISVTQGGSETKWDSPQIEPLNSRVFVLPSRRRFNPYFGKGSQTREQYISSYGLPPTRGGDISFQSRLFKIQENPGGFNEVLRRILEPIPTWYIDQNDSGQYYLKFRTGDAYHSSDGMGDGLVSLFFIVDSLYDSNQGNIIAIDEPELSLHPHFQKRLREVLCDFSKDRQIIVATHSPQFIDWEAIACGSAIIRVKQQNNRSVIFELGNGTKKEIASLLSDLNNPHVLGLDASEVFFLEDRVILVEGQEDVIFYPKVLHEINIDIPGHFFGWGVGGASKMPVIAAMLAELGFEKVVGLLDANQAKMKEELQKRFPQYFFEIIPANDVRTKPIREEQPQVIGLVDENGSIREQFKQQTIKIFERVRDKL
jgi:predicted ATP-dependent endonuclease of OLD family